MPSIGEIVRTYRELAKAYDSRHEDQMRDRFLVLAADAALTAGRNEEAERLRGLLLQRNPHHLLKPYASLAEGLKSADVRDYIAALRRSHPYERAEHLLATLSGHAGQDEAAQIPAGPAPEGPNRLAGAGDDIQIFRLRQEDDPRPATSQARQGKAAGPAKPSPVVPPARSPEIFALRPERPAPDNDLLARGEDQDRAGSVWVSLGLFLLVLVVGIISAFYTIMRPFLPQ